jgi:hypothetical protein
MDCSDKSMEPKKRGRPKGTKNLTSRVKVLPSLEHEIEPVCINAHKDDTVEPTHQNSNTMKVKNPRNRSDSRLTLHEMHRRRIEHLEHGASLDQDDVEYLTKACKHLVKRMESDSTVCLTKGSMLNDYLIDCYSNTYKGDHENVKEIYKLASYHSRRRADDIDDSCACEVYDPSKFVIDTSNATKICTVCGLCTNYQESSLNDSWDLRTQVLSKIAYKRVNHFREWLNSIQARQQMTDGLRKAINDVKQDIKKHRISENDFSKLTPEKIRACLHNLRLGKYYDHTSAIYADITGNPIPSFSYEIEKTLMQMFIAIQPVFDEMEQSSKKRKNFLSYSYTLHKLVQILGQNNVLVFFPLLKSREKLYAQDKLWKYICNKLKWDFHPSI